MGNTNHLAAIVLLASVSAGELATQEPRPRPRTNVPGRVVPAAEQPPAAGPTDGAVGPGLKGTAGCPPGVTAWWKQTAGTGRHGRIACAKDPTRPAILLFHGAQQDARAWTAPSYTESAYDHKNHPGPVKVGDTHEQENSGIYKVGVSKWLYGSKKGRAAWDQTNNWFDFLVKQGFTVATWSQDMLTVSDAMPSAREAFDSLLTQTAARNSAAPPPVALIAHSRGGLLIRQVLKENGSKGRVKWVVTLHSPHAGSELGRTPSRMAAEIVDLIDCCAPPTITGPFKPQLKELAVEAMRPMTKLIMAHENRELEPDSPLFRKLAEGEKKLGDVTYYTFGGTNPTVHRLYVWFFDAESAKPQYSTDHGQYFVWRTVPSEIGGVSPILDKIRDFAPEVTPGKGDGAVTDASSRLPWSIHTTDDLNHLELLWDKPLMGKVSGLIGRAPAVSTQRR